MQSVQSKEYNQKHLLLNNFKFFTNIELYKLRFFKIKRGII